jgi:hypothetical protein
MTWIGNLIQGYTLMWIGYEIVASQDKDTKATKACFSPFLDHIPKGAQYASFDARPLIQDLSLIPKSVGLIVVWSMIVFCLSRCWPTFINWTMGHKCAWCWYSNGLKRFIYDINDVLNVRFDNSKIVIVQISCLHIMFGVFFIAY